MAESEASAAQPKSKTRCAGDQYTAGRNVYSGAA